MERAPRVHLDLRPHDAAWLEKRFVADVEPLGLRPYPRREPGGRKLFPDERAGGVAHPVGEARPNYPGLVPLLAACGR